MLNQMQHPRPALPADEPAARFNPLTAILIVAAAFVVGFCAAAIWQVNWLAGLQTSVSGTAPTAFWYVSRSSAFVAFVLLWLSMVFGLSITNRLAQLWPGGPAAVDLHQYTSLLGLALGMFHGLILTGDSYSNYSLAQILVPFASTQYRPLWVGLGQLGLYIGILVTGSFYVRRWIGYRVWRLLHFLSFAFFVMVLFHGLQSGTDSVQLWARGLYLTSGLSVLALTVYRVVVARRAAAAKALRQRRVQTSPA